MLPEFTEAIRKNITHMINGVHTAFPGRIEKYDPEKNLANVQPVMKYKKPNGDIIDYPLLTGVPVWFPQTFGQKATIVYPIKQGDECLVICAERPIDYWLLGKETKTDLMFDLTEAVCIPGLFAKPNVLAKKAVEDEAIIAQLEDTYIEIKKDDIRLDSQKTINVYALDKVTVDAAKDVDVKSATKINMEAPEINLKGHVQIEGNVDITGDTSIVGDETVTGDASISGDTSVSGDVTAGDVSLSEHTHVLPEGGSTEPPTGGGGGGGGTRSLAWGIRDEVDANGGIIRHITGTNLANDTVSPEHLEIGYTAHDSEGNEIEGQLDPGNNR